MMIPSHACPWCVRLRLVAAIVAILVTTDNAHAEDAPGVSEMTREHLIAKVPSFFCFDYPFEPLPGKRLWLRVDDKSFVERYPDGSESRFKILGHAKAREMSGTVVVKIEGDPEKTLTDNEGGFQVFIPDKGNAEMAILFRHGRGGQAEWVDMSWSLNRKTLLEKVE